MDTTIFDKMSQFDCTLAGDTMDVYEINVTESLPPRSQWCPGGGSRSTIMWADINQQRTDPAIVDSVFCDLNDEYHRAREWGFTDLRCFDITKTGKNMTLTETRRSQSTTGGQI